MGYAYGSWSQSVNINSTVTSGKLAWGFQNSSLISLDAGNDYTSDASMTNITQTDQDVGNATGTFGDDSDGVPHLLTVNLNNTYPGYYNAVSANVVNVGTIPVYFEQAQLTWRGNQQTINEGQIYLMNSDGSVTAYNGGAIQETGSVLPLLEFCWNAQSSVYQLPTDQPFTEQFEVCVLDNVQQGANYSFSINMVANQFNHSS
jgi:hypothetical protein